MAIDSAESNAGRPRSRVAGAIRWTAAAGLLAGSAAWIVGERAMLPDLVAQFAVQVGVVAMVFAGWSAIRGRWALAAVSAVAVAISAIAVVPGRAQGGEPDGVPAGASDGRVRVLIYNANAGNENRDGVRGVIVSSDADVVGLLEAPAWLIDELRSGGDWRERYPHYLVSDRAGAGFKVVLSRWPQHRVEDGRRGERFTLVAGLRHMLLDRPGGTFAFTLVHPKSPRTPERWRAGAEAIDAVIERHRAAVAPRGIAHVVAADFNATPTGSRSRALARAGLRRTKPLLKPTGTFPSRVPGIASLAIDGVAVSDGVRVLDWQAIIGAGSDHRAVVVDLWVPSPERPVELAD